MTPLELIAWVVLVVAIVLLARLGRPKPARKPLDSAYHRDRAKYYRRMSRHGGTLRLHYLQLAQAHDEIAVLYDEYNRRMR